MDLKGRLMLGLMVIVLISLLAGINNQISAEELTILHTNDIHGRLEVDEEEGRMGIPVISSLIDDYRAERDNVLVLDAGDTIHGDVITNHFDGKSAVRTMNKAGFDVMVAGNREFMFGYERLAELDEEEMEFDLLSANIKKDGEPLYDPYVIKQAGEKQVGIFGLTTSRTQVTVSPERTRGLDFADYVDVSQKYVDLLQEKQVDLIIALGHVGTGTAEKVAKAVEGIDVFVDGHSHTVIEEGQWLNDTFHKIAGEYAKYLGVINVNLSKESPEFIQSAKTITAEEGFARVEADEEISQMLEEYGEIVVEDMLN